MRQKTLANILIFVAFSGESGEGPCHFIHIYSSVTGDEMDDLI